MGTDIEDLEKVFKDMTNKCHKLPKKYHWHIQHEIEIWIEFIRDAIRCGYPSKESLYASRVFLGKLEKYPLSNLEHYSFNWVSAVIKTISESA